MEFEFLVVGIVKEKIELFFGKYKKDLEYEFFCVSEFEEYLLYEQQKFVFFELEFVKIRNRVDVDVGYVCILVECIVEFERVFEVVEDEVDVYFFDK